MNEWDQLSERVEPLRQSLLQHPIYDSLHDIQSVRLFMQSHIFAVWDFMSLLKALQRNLCCVDVPWTPPERPDLARLINEIVLAEETDESVDGSFVSHFDLYRDAMLQAGANTTVIDNFISAVRRGETLESALAHDSVPQAARQFVGQTFQAIDSGHLPAIAAAFTFGREDLLPEVFTEVITAANRDASGQLSTFCYYLDRHIGLDGDEHGPLARKLVISLCGKNPENWQLAEKAVVASLNSRLELWNETAASIDAKVAATR